MFSSYSGTKLRELFENFENWRFYANFSQKMAWKWLSLGHFSWKIGMKPPIFRLFKKALLTLFPHMVGISGALTANLSKKLKVLIRLAWNISKFDFFSFFYKRSYQNRELQSAITFERKLILTFCKKPLFPLMELFQTTQNENFGPDPTTIM